MRGFRSIRPARMRAARLEKASSEWEVASGKRATTLLFAVRLVLFAPVSPLCLFEVTTMTADIRLHPDEGVLIARASLPPGLVVGDGVTTVERIPAGHKVAIRPIAQGEPIRRYGQIIGFATTP